MSEQRRTPISVYSISERRPNCAGLRRFQLSLVPRPTGRGAEGLETRLFSASVRPLFALLHAESVSAVHSDHAPQWNALMGQINIAV